MEKLFYFFSDKTKKMIVGWRHSVELTPWEETYQVIDNGNFLLNLLRISHMGRELQIPKGLRSCFRMVLCG